ncbi:hypothetical protein [Streptomyces spiramyceticus]|uniref:hypothetical protein n=1 Tax=Streptomyces spiramyceticus TaxID=299717 RepID=UPI00237B7801|nr:hypothetical protein [Streptomyces spiramyceticus]
MSHQDNAVFVDASGRRNRLMKYVAVLIGVVRTGGTPGRGTPAAPDAPGKGHDR